MLCYLLLPDIECSDGPSLKSKVVHCVCFCYSMPDWNNSIRYQSPGKCFHFLPVINSAGHFMSLLLHIQMCLRQHLLSRRAEEALSSFLYTSEIYPSRSGILAFLWLAVDIPISCTSQTTLTSNTGDTWTLGFRG